MECSKLHESTTIAIVVVVNLFERRVHKSGINDYRDYRRLSFISVANDGLRRPGKLYATGKGKQNPCCAKLNEKRKTRKESVGLVSISVSAPIFIDDYTVPPRSNCSALLT